MFVTDIQVVRAVFAAFADRDLEAVLALADPAVKFWAVTAHHAGRIDLYQGHDGLRQYFRDVAAVWEELQLTPGEFRQAGDMILVTGKVSARSRDRSVTGSTGWIWQVRDGLVVYGRVYASAADAIAALDER